MIRKDADGSYNMRRLLIVSMAMMSFGWLSFSITGAAENQPEAAPRVSEPKIPSGSDLLLQKCTICHGKKDFKKVNPDGSVRELYVDEDELKTSMHAKRGCTDCHVDVKEIPHKVRPERVNCSTCHYKGNQLGAPSDMYLKYQESVHGREVARGSAKAPVCRDCHGSHGIRRPDDPKSNVNRYNVPNTCGKCHLNVFAAYSTSVHGLALMKEHNPDVPSCTTCHGEHGIVEVKAENSPVNPANIATKCAKCHSAEGIMGKYGIETEQIETYKESFHGIAGRLGSRTVANCASCHGIHDIRPPQDPQSSVNMANIPRTCGKCHPNTNANYAKGKIHVNPRKREAGIIYWVGLGFKWLTMLTMFALIAHIGMDLYRKFKSPHKAGV